MSENRVLVADDDATVRLLAQAALEPHGFVVDCFEDGDSAWHALRKNDYDLVLLDVEMPGMDGFSLCEKIRTKMCSEVPVLLVTGHDDVASIQNAYDLGATDFIAKPINWPLLGHRLRYVLRSYRNLQSLDLAKARHRAMLRALPDTLWRVDTEGAVIEQHGQQSGRASHSARSLDALVPAPIAQQCLEAVKRAVASGHVQTLEYATTVSGKERVFEGRIAGVDQNEAICLFRDVTERREADQQIVSLAYFDPLTGLPNRTSFQAILKLSAHRAEREETRLAVLFLDIDGFKAVNDTFGHATGDQVLRAVSERLSSALRLSDAMGRNVPQTASVEPSLSRLGGDEFTVLLPNIGSAENAMQVAQRICGCFGAPFVIDNQEILLSTSVGISVFPDDASSPQLLVKHADTAMYAAKARGRAQAHFYSAALTERAMQRFKMESALRLALQRSELCVVYQPVIDVAAQRVTSFEALVRWNHPELGMLTPSHFTVVAEECGLIGKLGAFVLRAACEDAMKWNVGRVDEIGVAVNLSALQLAEPTLLEEIAEVLRVTQLPAHFLELEVTESAIVDRAQVALSNLFKLREMGIRIALDDFGTGYSSLAYLREMPLSSIKIDRTFVSDLPESSADEAIVRSIIALSQNFGLRVVGEGVETTKHVKALTSMGCNALQGYYYSRPIPLPNAIQFLNQFGRPTSPTSLV